MGQAPQQGAEGGLQFHPRQRRTQTEMDAGSEGEMRVRVPSEVQRVGPIVDVGVVVRAAEQQAELRAARDRHPPHLDRLQHPSLEHLQRGVESHELLDRGGDQRVIGP